jgi:cell fate (sporulation/competence/biofilm development) regulator YlbF (YheA/YmcA/DUF963 family)
VNDTAEIMTAAKGVSALIRESRAYREYAAAKDALNNEPNLAERIAEFRRLDAEYRKGVDNGFYHFDAEKRVSKIYWDLMLNQTAADYIRREREVTELITKAAGEVLDVFGEDEG